MNREYDRGTFVRFVNKPGIWIVTYCTYPMYRLKSVPDKNGNYSFAHGSHQELQNIDDPFYKETDRTGIIYEIKK